MKESALPRIRCTEELRQAVEKAAAEENRTVSNWIIDVIKKELEENRMKNLMEITGQESGIVVYGDSVIVANWASYESGLPMMSPFNSVMEWPAEELEVTEEYHVDDIREALPGKIVVVGMEDGKKMVEVEDMEILADQFGDICALWGHDIGGGATINTDDDGNLIPTPGKVFHINDAIVIAPEGWN
jgi:hypothetical protein